MFVVHWDRLVEALVLCVILPVEMSSVFLFVFMCLAYTSIDKFYLCWSLPFYTPIYSIIDALEHKGSVCYLTSWIAVSGMQMQ